MKGHTGRCRRAEQSGSTGGTSRAPRPPLTGAHGTWGNSDGHTSASGALVSEEEQGGRRRVERGFRGVSHSQNWAPEGSMKNQVGKERRAGRTGVGIWVIGDRQCSYGGLVQRWERPWGDTRGLRPLVSLEGGFQFMGRGMAPGLDHVSPTKLRACS